MGRRGTLKALTLWHFSPKYLIPPIKLKNVNRREYVNLAQGFPRLYMHMPTRLNAHTHITIQNMPCMQTQQHN